MMQWKFEHNLHDGINLQKKYQYKFINMAHKQQEVSSIIIKSNQSKIYAWDKIGQQRVLLFLPDNNGNNNDDDIKVKREQENSIIKDMQNSMGGVIRPIIIENVKSLNNGTNNGDDATACSISFRL